MRADLPILLVIGRHKLERLTLFYRLARRNDCFGLFDEAIKNYDKQIKLSVPTHIDPFLNDLYRNLFG